MAISKLQPMRPALDACIDVINGFEGDITSAVDEWLTEHPEATTTVQDGAITTAKLANGAVTDAKLSQTNDSVYDKAQRSLLTVQRVHSGNYLDVLADANDANDNTWYMLNFATNADVPIANLPVQRLSSTVSALFCYSDSKSSWPVQLQVLVDGRSMYSRTVNRYTSTYSAWTSIGITSNEVILKTSNEVVLNNDTITTNNYETSLADANDAEPNRLYSINIAVGDPVPDNLPFDTSPDGWLLFADIASGNQTLVSSQFVMTRYGIWYRWINRYTGNYRSWVKYPVSKTDIYVTKGALYPSVTDGLIFSNLTEAVYYAQVTAPGTVDTIYIMDGTYDLVTEFETKFGSLENFGSEEEGFNGFAKGLRISDFNIVGFGNSLITFNYTGSNSFIWSRFSPITNAWQGQLNGRPSDYILEGLHIECSNCQYAFHDELASAQYTNVSKQHHVVRNCHFEKDNSDGHGSAQVIGGGLGTNTLIELYGNVFKRTPAATSQSGIVSYHNNRATISQSRILIHDNYVDGGTIRISSYGDSTKITEALICNNSLLGYEPYTTLEVPESYTTVNVSIIAFNNEIREM